MIAPRWFSESLRRLRSHAGGKGSCCRESHNIGYELATGAPIRMLRHRLRKHVSVKAHSVARENQVPREPSTTEFACGLIDITRPKIHVRAHRQTQRDGIRASCDTDAGRDVRDGRRQAMRVVTAADDVASRCSIREPTDIHRKTQSRRYYSTYANVGVPGIRRGPGHRRCRGPHDVRCLLWNERVRATAVHIAALHHRLKSLRVQYESPAAIAQLDRRNHRERN